MRVIRIGEGFIAAYPLYSITTNIDYALRLTDATDAASIIAAALEKTPGLAVTGWIVEPL